MHTLFLVKRIDFQWSDASPACFQCFYLFSGLSMIHFIQMHYFHHSSESISIYFLGAARGTLRLHSRELFVLLLLFTSPLDTGGTVV